MRIILTFFVLIFAVGIMAELPPMVYERLQKNAHEVVILRAERVKTAQSGLVQTDVHVRGSITRVIRSKSGLRTSDVVTVSYSITNRAGGWVGPRPIPLLSQGKLYKAYLKPSGRKGHYLPAARGKSFVSIAEEQ